MIALDSWVGFTFLLIVPLLYWQQRHASAQQEVPISLFPVLTRQKVEDPAPSRRLLRFTNNQRLLFLTIALFSLALSFNGVHIVRKDRQPGRWLIVLDNTSGSSAQFENGTVLSEMVSSLKVFSRRAHEKDLFTLVVTSPTPVIFDQLDRKAFTAHLSRIRSASTSSSIGELSTTTSAMQEGVEYKGAILVSPRSKQWRRFLSDERSDPGLWIPSDQLLERGNAGLITIDVTSVAGNLYDIYGRIASEGLGTGPLEMSYNHVNSPSVFFTVDLDRDGEGEFHLLEVPITKPEVSLQLEVHDNLASDNRLTIIPPENLSSINVQLQGNESDFLKLALSAFRELHPVSDNPATARYHVSIHEKSVPKNNKTASPALIIFPPRSFGPFQIRRIWAAPMDISFHPGHPVTRGASFRQFRTARILDIPPPAGFKTLASAQGIPLIMAGTMEGQKVVVWTFDPGDNGIYLDPAFPVLLRNSLVWLARSGETQVKSESCIAGTVSDTARPEECASLVREAGAISLPLLTGIADDPRLIRSETRKELGNMFLILALAFLLVMAADRALYREEAL
ncbi:MAG: hypothetical protein P1S46_01655 [bacterium]|nr:hypothetical protein [bacterium]